MLQKLDSLCCLSEQTNALVDKVNQRISNLTARTNEKIASLEQGLAAIRVEFIKTKEGAATNTNMNDIAKETASVNQQIENLTNQAVTVRSKTSALLRDIIGFADKMIAPKGNSDRTRGMIALVPVVASIKNFIDDVCDEMDLLPQHGFYDGNALEKIETKINDQPSLTSTKFMRCEQGTNSTLGQFLDNKDQQAEIIAFLIRQEKRLDKMAESLDQIVHLTNKR